MPSDTIYPTVSCKCDSTGQKITFYLGFAGSILYFGSEHVSEKSKCMCFIYCLYSTGEEGVPPSVRPFSVDLSLCPYLFCYYSILFSQPYIEVSFYFKTALNVTLEIVTKSPPCLRWEFSDALTNLQNLDNSTWASRPRNQGTHLFPLNFIVS